MKLVKALVFGCLGCSLVLEAREWTNAEGKVIEADFVELAGDEVVISMKGKEYRVLLTNFSEEDQEFARAETARLAEAAKEAASNFMGQKLKPGETITFDFSLSPENQEVAQKGGKGWGNSFSGRYSADWLGDLAKGHEVTEVKFILGIPEGFDPAKGSPIFVQWTTSDAKSNLKGAKGYWDSCRKKGWILLSVDGLPDAGETWSNPVFYAGMKEFFGQLHAAYPSATEWPVATGGFSGGAKLCQWMGGLMNELEGVNVVGYYLGGCNEAFFTYADEDLGVSKKSYRDAKAFISSGDSDKLVKDEHRDRVEAGCDGAGLEVRNEVYSGGHRMDREEFEKALDWFLE